MPEGRSLPAACTRTSAYVQVMLWAVAIICAALWSSAAACGNLNISRPAAYLSAMADFPQDYCIESAGHLSPGDSTLDARCILHVWFSIMGDTLSELLRKLDQGGRLYRDVENLFNYANSIQIDCVSVDENTCSLSALVHKEAITPSYFRALMLKSFQAVRFMNGQPGAVPATVLARWLPTESAAQLGKACVCSEVCRPAAETTSPPVSSQTNAARAAGWRDGGGLGATVGTARGAAGRAVRDARRPVVEAARASSPTPAPRHHRPHGPPQTGSPPNACRCSKRASREHLTALRFEGPSRTAPSAQRRPQATSKRRAAAAAAAAAETTRERAASAQRCLLDVAKYIFGRSARPPPPPPPPPLAVV
ncbi:uncharacterized protein LOC144718701 isoform X3 [Lampetra planeri]